MKILKKGRGVNRRGDNLFTTHIPPPPPPHPIQPTREEVVPNNLDV